MDRFLFRQKIVYVLAGIMLALAALELGMRITGKVLSYRQNRRNTMALQRSGAYRILCLGESTTAGQWPLFLEEMLNEKKTGLKFTVIDKGVPGTNTGFIVSMLEENIDRYKPDMVITMMGANDVWTNIVYRGTLAVRTEIFLKNFRIYKLFRILAVNIAGKIQIRHDVKEAATAPVPEHDYLKLAGSYEAQGQYGEAIAMYRKAIEADPDNSRIYQTLGMHYREQEKYEEAERVLQRAIEIDPRNDYAYVELGRCYLERKMWDKGIPVLEKAIDINPRETYAYLFLGMALNELQQCDKAIGILKGALNSDPDNVFALEALAICSEGPGLFKEREYAFKRLIARNHRAAWAYVELGRSYGKQGRFAEERALYESGIESYQRKDFLYRLIALSFEKEGRHNMARRYFNMAAEMSMKQYDHIMAQNYRLLKDIVKSRGLQLVCVQYPMRSAEPLKAMFEVTEGVIFADNEKIFKDAVAAGGYGEYFVDNFGGDFGHCTDKGNRLLAGNIADTIEREYFSGMPR